MVCEFTKKYISGENIIEEMDREISELKEDFSK